MMYGLVILRFNLRDLEIFVRYHRSQELILRAILTSDILITARMNLMRDFNNHFFYNHSTILPR